MVGTRLWLVSRGKWCQFFFPFLKFSLLANKKWVSGRKSTDHQMIVSYTLTPHPLMSANQLEQSSPPNGTVNHIVFTEGHGWGDSCVTGRWAMDIACGARAAQRFPSPMRHSRPRPRLRGTLRKHWLQTEHRALAQHLLQLPGTQGWAWVPSNRK